MKTPTPAELLEKMAKGPLTPVEEAQLEGYIAQGVVDIDALPGFGPIGQTLSSWPPPTPSGRLDASFYASLRKSAKKRPWRMQWLPYLGQPTVQRPWFRLVYSLLLLAIGMLVGPWLNRPVQYGSEVAKLSNEVNQMREMVTLSLISQNSASMRLKAVAVAREGEQASDKVIMALFQTLNGDQNINVRLAALEALVKYASRASVRERLVRSIAQQKSPHLLVAMAEVMVALQEKSAVGVFDSVFNAQAPMPEVQANVRALLSPLI